MMDTLKVGSMDVLKEMKMAGQRAEQLAGKVGMTVEPTGKRRVDSTVVLMADGKVGQMAVWKVVWMADRKASSKVDKSVEK